jgi:uncharacterized protein
MMSGMISTTGSSQAQTKSNGLEFAASLPAHANASGRGIPPRAVRNVELRGPAGRLEALLNHGAPDAPFAALVCHPHPLGGGNLHNKVVYHAMKALNDPVWGLGWPVLRFNFRGAGRSEGRYDGDKEVEDVLAALAWLENEFKVPMVVSGFSFGAATSIKASCDRPQVHDVRALVALGLPVEAEGRRYDYSFLQHAVVPKLFLSGDRDPFAPAAQLRQIAASASDPKQLVLLPGADHFFTGQLEPMQQTLAGWLKEQFL